PVTKSGRKKQGQRIVGFLRVGAEAGSPSEAQPAPSTQPIHRDRGNPTAKTQIPSPNHSGVDERLQEYGSLVDEALPRSGLGPPLTAGAWIGSESRTPVDGRSRGGRLSRLKPKRREAPSTGF